MKSISIRRAILVLAGMLACCVTPALQADAPLPALKVDGSHFVDSAGHPVRFWGVNLVALYPDHAQAEALAANLESLGINLVRPHHLLRPSLDWNPGMVSGSLALYKTNSRDFDPDALDRFDFLTASLRRHGIYLALGDQYTRQFRSGDVDILITDDQDRQAWMSAIDELNGWDWQKSFDVYKLLPDIDERSALLHEEFTRKFLTHSNPYSGTTLAADTQSLTMEVMNESSAEYIILCGNHFPDYFQKKLLAKWSEFATAAGIPPGDLYKPADAQAVQIRGRFCRKLDEDYFARIKKVVRETGCNAAMEYSNLWRGENSLAMENDLAETIEDHFYGDPLVAGDAHDLFYDLSKTQLTGKPYIVGEINQAEGEDNIRKQSPNRTMLPLAAAAYGSLQDWSGIVWFAFTHGASPLGADGWSTNEGRASDLGRMVNDGMMLDHLRTSGLIFRQRMLATSTAPITLAVDPPYSVGDYDGLIRGKYPYQPGWQNIHAVSKSFGTVPADQAAKPWMIQAPPNPSISDTGEITKDTTRKQLVITAPRVEAFSGYLDAQPATSSLHVLTIDGTSGFATVIVVAADQAPLSSSHHLIISRTALDAQNAEVTGPTLHLHGLVSPSAGAHWYFRTTRPRTSASTETALEASGNGVFDLPSTEWHEAELTLEFKN